MKLRAGFVSNSSSCSFTIYGWDFKTYDEANELYEKLCQYKKYEYLLQLTYDSQTNYIIGIGYRETEFDHYMEDWDSYECDPPPKEATNWLDEVVKELNLPPPEMIQDTWYDG